MYIGDLIPAAAPPTAPTLFTSWFPRQADNAIFTYEIIDAMGGTSFSVRVFHKNKEDPGEGEPAEGVGSPEWTADGTLYTGTFMELKEMVRFEVTSGTSGLGVCYRFLSPTWFNDAS